MKLSPLCLVFATVLACGGEAATTHPAVTVPVSTATPPPAIPPSAVGAPFDVDPVVTALHTDRSGVASDVAAAKTGVVLLCESALVSATELLRSVRDLDGQPDGALNWDSTLGKLDRVALMVKHAGDFPGLLAVAHPDAGVREAAKSCEPKIDAFDTNLWLDARVARVVKRYAKKNQTLPVDRARLLDHTLRDFRRNGLDLDEKGQTRLRALNTEITSVGQQFESNIAASHLTVHAKPARLLGMPKEWLAQHPAGKDGDVEISTDYPDYYPVLTYARDRALALELSKQFDNRASDTNVRLLERLLQLRAEKAKLLGYATWADYAIEPRMAKDAKTVASFLEGLKSHLAKKAAAEMAEFRTEHVKLGGKASDPIPPSDRLYLEDRLRQTKYGLDSKEVSQYFEVTKVKAGLLAIVEKMFNVRFRPGKMPTWHADVEPMEVTDESGKLLGRFYFDLYPREGKFKHAAVFGIRDTTRLDDGSRLLPMAAIECNFPKPGGGGPALMTHQDVTTFFHEFGHVMHHVLSNAPLGTFSGTSVQLDFVESPSQMLEEWAWDKSTLALFAVHHETGKALPEKLHAAMLRSRSFGRALATQRQLFLAALDLAYHTRATPDAPLDTTKIVEELNDAYTPFKYVPGTHFQASFGHLVGYDAGYYGYQWALSIAQDLFTRFKKAGLLDATTAADYRKNILEPGGSEDASVLVTKFLGRAPNDAAYRAFLVE